MDNNRLQELLDRYESGDCTPEELRELEMWYTSLASNSSNERLPQTEWNNAHLEQKYKDFLHLIGSPEANRPKRHLVRALHNRWIQAAASIALLVTLYFTLVDNKKGEAITEAPQKRTIDIAPGKDKAILTLSNGERILLDTVASGPVTTQGERISPSWIVDK